LEREEWQLFVTGSTKPIEIPINPCIWISDTAWPEVYLNLHTLQEIPRLKGLLEEFQSKPIQFRGLYYQEDDDIFKLPGTWN
jgi:hypothetical protein